MPPRKRAQDDTTSHKSKKQKLLDSGKHPSNHSPPDDKANEVDFPRGGGSNFTPLEHKIIENEAISEVNDELFKAKSIKVLFLHLQIFLF